MQNGSGANSSRTPARVLYREIVEGDFRKFEAKSNDSDSGGGARDLRFRPYDKLKGTVELMFPQIVTEQTGKRKIQVRKGVFQWLDSNGGEHSKDAYFYPPTDSRPGEWRLARVHEHPCFTRRLPPTNQGRILVLLTQLTDGKVWPSFATERDLQTNKNWNTAVATALLNCINASRPSNKVATGFYDFQSTMKYCND